MSDTIVAMPGVTLPAAREAQQQAADAKFVSVLEELLQLAKDGKIRWLAATGQFDNGQKLSLFGNIQVADPVYVAGAISFLEEELKNAVRTQAPVAPR